MSYKANISSCDLFIFAGEKSGDLHGARLLSTLKKRFPSFVIAGVGGPEMRNVGLECVMPMEAFQVMGFVDVFLKLPSLIHQFYIVAQEIQRLRPKLVLTIDYPGFNLRLARHLRHRGFTGKLCHFICPSVWAWGKGRIPLMANHLDLLLCVLPFEEKLFENTHLKTVYVGHPLVERLASHIYKPFPIQTDQKIVAIFPGSRKKEIERNLPLHLEAAARLSPAFHVVISISSLQYEPLIRLIVDQIDPTLSQRLSLLSSEYTYELMQHSHLAIAKSGTVTLELALHRVPTVVTYAISPLDVWIARDLLRIRLPFYCLVNIIAGKEVFPELFGPSFTTDSLWEKIEELLCDARHASCKYLCDELALLLGQKNSAETAVTEIAKLFI